MSRPAMSRLLACTLAALTCLSVIAVPALADGSVQVYLTGNDGHTHLTRQPDLQFHPSASSLAETTIAVDSARRYQRIVGFGGALTDSSLYLLSRLPATQRAAVLRRLLTRDPATGSAGFAVMRVPMGASDFTASGLYSYDDNAGAPDPSLRHFSIAHDEAYIIPALRDALAIDPHLRIVANPWSPPGWMKTNDSMLGVSLTGGPGVIEPRYYRPLARYFVKFIRAYAAAGIPIWAVTPQNEPEQPAANYPGAFMTADQEALFVRRYLAPALRRAHLRTRIYGYDYVWAGSEPYTATLATLAGRHLAGIAYHCYFGEPDSMAVFHHLFPRLDLIEDECSTGISVLSPIQNLIRSVDNWASAALMWNVALDPSGGPKVGSGCLNCTGLLTVNPATAAVTYNGGYWQLAQASAFLPPGSRRIKAKISPALPTCGSSPICGLEAAAFQTPHHETVLVVTNSDVLPSTFAVTRPDGQSFTYTLPGQNAPRGTDNSRDASVVTFVWAGTGG